MARYQISNTVSGAVLGEYEAEDEQGALDALARDAGYESHAAACEVVPTKPGELAVERLEA